MTLNDKPIARAPWRLNVPLAAMTGIMWLAAWGLVIIQAFAPLR